MRTWIQALVLLLANVAAHAAATCSVTSAGIAFGSYDPIAGREADTAGSITVTCMGTVGDSVSLRVMISPGRGTYQSRQMVSGNRSMRYNLYVDPNRSQVWGDGTSGTTVVGDVLRLTAPSVIKTYVVYARIMGSQRQLMARTYLDDLMVSLSY